MHLRLIALKFLLFISFVFPSCNNERLRSSIFPYEKCESNKGFGSRIESSNVIEGRVIGIKDGDTIEILFEGEPVVVRLADVDSPEKNQPFGQKAKKFTSDFCYNRFVTVKRNKKRDRYKRIIGTVYLDGKNLNEELLKAGLAWHYKRYSGSPHYSALEREARGSKVGLWSTKNPVYPEKWRKSKHSKKNIKQERVGLDV